MPESIMQDQHLFFKAFESAPIGMALVNLDGTFRKVNPALRNMLGYSEAELVKSMFESLTYPKDLEESLHFLQKIKTGEIDSYRIEKRYIHKSGKIIWALLNVTVEKDPQGSFDFLISQLVDITEQKAQEEELKKIKELHELIAEHSQDMIISFTSEGIITYVSPAVSLHLGYEPKELIGKNGYQLWHPEDLDLQWLEQANSETRKIIYRSRHKNGHYVWQESLSKKIILLPVY